jgi:hypothetical protein
MMDPFPRVSTTHPSSVHKNESIFVSMNDPSEKSTMPIFRRQLKPYVAELSWRSALPVRGQQVFKVRCGTRLYEALISPENASTPATTPLRL